MVALAQNSFTLIVSRPPDVGERPVPFDSVFRSVFKLNEGEKNESFKKFRNNSIIVQHSDAGFCRGEEGESKTSFPI
jgi:hypothetical protein